jgi:hypothetical protein
MLFVPCILDYQFTTLNQQNPQRSSLDVCIILYYKTCFNPQGIIIREQVSKNVIKRI